MAPNPLYIIAVWIITGMGLGFLATAYGACRRTYRVLPGVGQFLDWFWFVLASAAFLIVAFWTEWGTFRVWAVAFILVGYGLWAWLAAPLVLGALSLALYGQARLTHYILVPGFVAARFVRRRVRHAKKPPRKE